MRLIDADSIQIPHFTLATDRIKMIDAIDEAPTIEPKRGEWIDKGDRYWYCSECGTKDTDTWDWCHGCGADMREREGE